MSTISYEISTDDYAVENTARIVTPALLVYEQPLEANIARMVSIAKSPSRLRPHCKTHKMPRVIERQLRSGITKHKAATFAEAEMLANAGVLDVFLAYNLVGANVERAVKFSTTYPRVELSVTADDSRPVRELGAALAEQGQSLLVLLDLDTGQHRTGIPCGDEAIELYRSLVETPGIEPGGIHLYDGHNHQTDLEDRRIAVLAGWNSAKSLASQLVEAGWPVPRIVAGGTGSFPILADVEDDSIELSPGTCIFHDVGYGQMFPDLDFQPAALLLTRVVSRPTAERVTLDLGYKAVASDPPADRRVLFPMIPDAQLVLQNEEHLVIETSQAGEFSPGDELLAIPRHICPTSALHKQAFLIRDGKYVEDWEVGARDRWLTI